MSPSTLTSDELAILETSLKTGTKIINIRLRKGEYQHDLAKAIASFEQELRFPNAKDLIRKIYGEEKAEKPQFVQKIQTILKKMEKSSAIKILPKTRPWELQKYALVSFKFQDVEKNLIVLATESELEKTLNIARAIPITDYIPKPNRPTVRILLLVVAIASYATILWTLTQTTFNPIIFALTFCSAAACSILFGVTISRKE